MRLEHRVVPLLALLSLAACDARAPVDAGTDADVELDAGTTPPDANGLDAGEPPGDGGPRDAGDSDAGALDGGDSDAGGSDAGVPDAGSDAGPPDAGGPPTFDVRILADAFCDMLRFDPPSIAVPRGTEFTVNWINATGCTEIDIDMGGTVPIVIGLTSGDSHHDTVRRWCGTFTGTYTFRAYYAPSYPFTMRADCDG